MSIHYRYQSSLPNLRAVTLLSCAAVALASCKPGAEVAADATRAPLTTAFYANDTQRPPGVEALTAVGRALFSAPELSASGKLACVSCHDPKHAYGPPNALAVQRGGSDGTLSGARAVPSLRYLQAVPRFSEHFQDSDGDGSDQGPAGGYTWDGRAQTVHDQARLPLFSCLEMANRSLEELIERVRKAPVAASLRATFGNGVLVETETAMRAILLALEVFQQSPADFYPYDSKYDAVLRRQARLSEQEARGLSLFNNPKKGNCALCHPSIVKEGAFPAFTDYGFVALGVPRNRAIPANADSRYFDLGLCGPYRTDLSKHPEYCGLFRVPSLRNITTRSTFFHNGSVHTLRDAVRFYAERDSHPERWYPRAGRKVRKYDDLPEQLQANVNVEPPFGQAAGAADPLSAVEIDDLVAFLGTLQDGYLQAAPATGQTDVARR